MCRVPDETVGSVKPDPSPAALCFALSFATKHRVFQLKFATWNFKILTTQYKWNAAQQFRRFLCSLQHALHLDGAAIRVNLTEADVQSTEAAMAEEMKNNKSWIYYVVK